MPIEALLGTFSCYHLPHTHGRTLALTHTHIHAAVQHVYRAQHRETPVMFQNYLYSRGYVSACCDAFFVFVIAVAAAFLFFFSLFLRVFCLGDIFPLPCVCVCVCCLFLQRFFLRFFSTIFFSPPCLSPGPANRVLARCTYVCNCVVRMYTM